MTKLVPFLRYVLEPRSRATLVELGKLLRAFVRGYDTRHPLLRAIENFDGANGDVDPVTLDTVLARKLRELRQRLTLTESDIERTTLQRRIDAITAALVTA